MPTATIPSKRLYPTNAARHPMSSWLHTGLRTTVGSKFIVALTGLALTAFVVQHMVMNLLVFKGRDALNAYAQSLQNLGGLLWIARIVLLAIFLLHIINALQLAARNRVARPMRYVHEKTVQASWASRHMVLTGLVILAFVIFHLMHFTLGLAAATAPDGRNFNALHDSLGRHDVYAMTIYGFRNVPVSIAYIIAQLFLGLHLSHGVASTFQSMGWCHPRFWPLLRGIGWIVAIVVVVGNIVMPLAAMTGITGVDVPGSPPFPIFGK